jgi:hypothetical protein
LEFLVNGPSADGAAAASAVDAAASAVDAAASAVDAAAVALVLAVETDSLAVLLDSIDMSSKILPRPTIANEVKAITVVKTIAVPNQRLLL